MQTTTDHRESLGLMIAGVLASTDPLLGLTAEQASAACDLIAGCDQSDDAALRAYDLLYARATFGRAW